MQVLWTHLLEASDSLVSAASPSPTGGVWLTGSLRGPVLSLPDEGLAAPFSASHASAFVAHVSEDGALLRLGRLAATPSDTNDELGVGVSASANGTPVTLASSLESDPATADLRRLRSALVGEVNDGPGGDQLFAGAPLLAVSLAATPSGGNVSSSQGGGGNSQGSASGGGGAGGDAGQGVGGSAGGGASADAGAGANSGVGGMVGTSVTATASVGTAGGASSPGVDDGYCTCRAVGSKDERPGQGMTFLLGTLLLGIRRRARSEGSRNSGVAGEHGLVRAVRAGPAAGFSGCTSARA